MFFLDPLFGILIETFFWIFSDKLDKLLVKKTKKKQKYKNKSKKQVLQYLKDSECEIWLPNKEYVDEKTACYHLYSLKI